MIKVYVVEHMWDNTHVNNNLFSSNARAYKFIEENEKSDLQYGQQEHSKYLVREEEVQGTDGESLLTLQKRLTKVERRLGNVRQQNRELKKFIQKLQEDFDIRNELDLKDWFGSPDKDNSIDVEVEVIDNGTKEIINIDCYSEDEKTEEIVVPLMFKDKYLSKNFDEIESVDEFVSLDDIPELELSVLQAK